MACFIISKASKWMLDADQNWWALQIALSSFIIFRSKVLGLTFANLVNAVISVQARLSLINWIICLMVGKINTCMAKCINGHGYRCDEEHAHKHEDKFSWINVHSIRLIHSRGSRSGTGLLSHPFNDTTSRYSHHSQLWSASGPLSIPNRCYRYFYPFSISRSFCL